MPTVAVVALPLAPMDAVPLCSCCGAAPVTPSLVDFGVCGACFRARLEARRPAVRPVGPARGADEHGRDDTDVTSKPPSTLTAPQTAAQTVQKPRKPAAIEPGDQFGRLTVIDRTADGDYVCECSCGELWTGPAHPLTSGNTSSCGCLRRERATLRAAEARERREREIAERQAARAAAEAERQYRDAYDVWIASRHAGSAARCAETGCPAPRYLRGRCSEHYHATIRAETEADRSLVAA